MGELVVGVMAATPICCALTHEAVRIAINIQYYKTLVQASSTVATNVRLRPLSVCLPLTVPAGGRFPYECKLRASSCRRLGNANSRHHAQANTGKTNAQSGQKFRETTPSNQSTNIRQNH